MSRNTIAVCIVKMNENVQSDSIKAITRRAEERGLNVEIYNSFVELVNKDLHDKGEESIFELIDYRHLCGIILFPEKIKSSKVNDQIIKYGKEHNLPVISIDRKIPDCISITYDYTRAFEEIVEHLITVHSCRKFYMMAGVKDNSFSDDRVDAAKRIINRYGAELPEDYIGYGDFWDGPARKTICEFLESGKPLPDAFIAANDTMAMVICDELNKKGLKVPDDVIVTGFDGIESEKYAVPRLTTAETDLERSGFMAVDAILSCIGNRKSSLNHYVVPFNTRFSESCGCCKTSNVGVNGMMQSLYNELSSTRSFIDMMASMLTRMAAKKDLLSMMKDAERYRGYLDEYDDIYVCLRKDIALTDELLGPELVIPEDLAGSSDETQNDRQMVLLWESHLYQKDLYPLTVFRSREMLPGRTELIDKLRNVCFLPLHVQDKVYGYVAFGLKPHQKDYDYTKIEYFSRNLSQAISYVLQILKNLKANDKIKAANEKLEELYITDYLTGINNRRGFFKHIEEKKKSGLYKAFMIASIDLNGLKLINDKYGHHEGDRAICLVADLMKKLMDENCVCARFGGDEFSFCKFFEIPGPNEDDEFCNKFRGLVNKQNDKGEMPYLFSASCGAVIVPIESIDILDKVINEADEKMYEEKALFHRTHKEYEKRRADRQ
ncbi:MAG: GGDEF domain-containing protein [Lachnospiraceae bacterium]|nr:GGDEF domain-containing protein [Lachnospiraceae bacterium]